ncbi:MAG: Ig-like domain-containing protein [Anaerolineae bacterium]
MKTAKLYGKVNQPSRLVAGVALAVIAGFLFSQTGLAQVETQEFFKETGHWVKGEFLIYFRTYGGLEIFGYPITEQFSAQGVTVQYFQKARMEWHPENPKPYRVQLGLLGEELNYRQPAVPEPLPRSHRKVYFPETGHTVAYAFLDFFKAKGGIDIFGYPITEMYFENGQIVQYFQRLKLQWQPNASPPTVVVGDLGEIYVSLYGQDLPPEAWTPPADARPETATATASVNIDGLRAVVSLRYAVMFTNRNQTVSVLVTDRNGNPVPGARVEVSFVEMASNVTLTGSYQILITDKRGFAKVSLPVYEECPGKQIVVRAVVSYGIWSTTAQNVFLLWK